MKICCICGAFHTPFTNMANYTVRMCIAQGRKCSYNDIVMQTKNATYQEEQKQALDFISYNHLYLKIFFVVCALLLIVIAIVSSFNNPLWFDVIVPNGGPSESIEDSLKDSSWRSTRLANDEHIRLYNYKCIAKIQKTALIDNMYRCTTLIGTWIFIVIADWHTLELMDQLLPPSLPYAQIIGKINAIKTGKSIATVAFAMVIGVLVWSTTIVNYIPTIVGIIDDEKESVHVNTYRTEIRKTIIKRAESWFDKTLDSILAVAVIAIIRAIFARVAYKLNYTSIADYNTVASIISMPFVIDVPIYAVTLLGSVVTIGLSVVQYKTVQDYIKTSGDGCRDLAPMNKITSGWILTFIIVNNPIVSVYFLHFNIIPILVGIVVSPVVAVVIRAIISENMGIIVAAILGVFATALTYAYQKNIRTSSNHQSIFKRYLQCGLRIW